MEFWRKEGTEMLVGREGQLVIVVAAYKGDEAQQSWKYFHSTGMSKPHWDVAENRCCASDLRCWKTTVVVLHGSGMEMDFG